MKKILDNSETFYVNTDDTCIPKSLEAKYRLVCDAAKGLEMVQSSLDERKN